MDAQEQGDLAARLSVALAAAGLEVVRAQTQGGNIVDYLPVPAETVIGALMQRRWVIRRCVPPAVAVRPLRLERDG